MVTIICCACSGAVDQVLEALSGLPSLTFIDFASQRLYGTLPANVSFPKLKFINLSHNMLQVPFSPLNSCMHVRCLLWDTASCAAKLNMLRPVCYRSPEVVQPEVQYAIDACHRLPCWLYCLHPLLLYSFHSFICPGQHACASRSAMISGRASDAWGTELEKSLRRIASTISHHCSFADFSKVMLVWMQNLQGTLFCGVLAP